MKRSEMIAIMVEAGDSEFVMTLEQIADRMLDAQEEAGMLPPSDISMTVECWDDFEDSLRWTPEHYNMKELEDEKK